MSEEEFADDNSHQMQALTEDVVGRLLGQGADLDMETVGPILNRMPDSVFYTLSDEGRGLLGQEVAAEMLRNAGGRLVRGRHVELAARRIGTRIRAGGGEFSRLSEADRNEIIDGCPWC